MTHEIKGPGYRPSDTSGAHRTDATRSTPSRTAAETSPKPTQNQTEDTVNLTRTALLMRKLEDVVQNAPVVDADRMRTIKSALNAGNYEIDDQRTADRMLRAERESAE